MDSDHRWNDWMKGCWSAVQKLIKERKILSGHDVSDGGIMIALCEMCFAAELSITGNTIGIQLLHNNRDSTKWLQSAPAIVMEVAESDMTYVKQVFQNVNVSSSVIGHTIS